MADEEIELPRQLAGEKRRMHGESEKDMSFLRRSGELRGSRFVCSAPKNISRLSEGWMDGEGDASCVFLG